MQRIGADKWYQVRRLGDDVTAISEPFIQQFYRCNIWHVRGRDRDMLIDSGMGVVSLREWVPLVTERGLIAVASHTHFDHIGCHHEFECRAVHSAEADLLANPTREKYACRSLCHRRDFRRAAAGPLLLYMLCRKKSASDAHSRGW